MVENFIGRERELSDLNRLLEKKTASMVVIKGRRRVGKSRLIQEFVKKRRHILLRGLAPRPETTAQEQRDEFARQLAEVTELPEVSANDWATLFTLLGKETKTGRVIIVLDEISWMGSKDATFLGKLKDAWEQHYKKNPKLMLVLCGSISIWIDEEILNSTEFYGRVSWKISLKELPLRDANKMLENNGFRGSIYEKFKILSITGGIPWYLEQIQPNFSAEENIKHHCFSTGGVLVSEYDRIFKEIFGKRSEIYRKIVKAIVEGALTYEEISEASEYKSSGRLSQYLNQLSDADFIAKEHSWCINTGKKNSRVKYRLTDNYLRFYLKHIEPRREQIELDRFRNMSLSFLPGWETIMGLQFENLVLNNRQILLKKLNIREEEIIYDNPYLQMANKHRKSCQIDYLVQTKHKNLFAFEIKLSKNAIGTKVITEMEEKIKRLDVPRGYAVLPVLVHLSGVTNSLRERNYFYSLIDFQEVLSVNN